MHNPNIILEIYILKKVKNKELSFLIININKGLVIMMYYKVNKASFFYNDMIIFVLFIFKIMSSRKLDRKCHIYF